MKILIVFVLLISVALVGCSNTRVYTFQKERVDQDREGNRGYLVGTPPPEPVTRETPKRMLFGLDIEIPVLPWEKAPSGSYEETDEEIVAIEEDVEIENAPRPEEVNFEPKKKAEETYEETEEVMVEEEWVK